MSVSAKKIAGPPAPKPKGKTVDGVQLTGAEAQVFDIVHAVRQHQWDNKQILEFCELYEYDQEQVARALEQLLEGKSMGCCCCCCCKQSFGLRSRPFLMTLALVGECTVGVRENHEQTEDWQTVSTKEKKPKKVSCFSICCAASRSLFDTRMVCLYDVALIGWCKSWWPWWQSSWWWSWRSWWFKSWWSWCCCICSWWSCWCRCWPCSTAAC